MGRTYADPWYALYFLDEVSNTCEQEQCITFTLQNKDKYGDLDPNPVTLFDNDDMGDPLLPDLPHDASITLGNDNSEGLGDNAVINGDDIVRGPIVCCDILSLRWQFERRTRRIRSSHWCNNRNTRTCTRLHITCTINEFI